MDALQGIKVVELPGLAPVPFCAQILSHFGADVTFVEVNTSFIFTLLYYLICLQKLNGSTQLTVERQLMDGKKIVQFDFKKDLSKLEELILKSDVLLDPYR